MVAGKKKLNKDLREKLKSGKEISDSNSLQQKMSNYSWGQISLILKIKTLIKIRKYSQNYLTLNTLFGGTELRR